MSPITIPPKNPRPKEIPLWREATRYEFTYSIWGLVAGVFLALVGVVLLIHGVAGSTNWTTKLLSAESEISDAAPGVILFIVGLFVVYITRFQVKVK